MTSESKIFAEGDDDPPMLTPTWPYRQAERPVTAGPRAQGTQAAEPGGLTRPDSRAALAGHQRHRRRTQSRRTCRDKVGGGRAVSGRGALGIPWGPAGTQRRPHRVPRTAGGAPAVTPTAAAVGTGGDRSPGGAEPPGDCEAPLSSRLHGAGRRRSLAGPSLSFERKTGLERGSDQPGSPGWGGEGGRARPGHRATRHVARSIAA